VKRGERRVPLLAALAAAAVAVMTLVLVGGAAAGVVPPSGDPPLGGTLSEDDRVALDAPSVQRGAPPVPPARGVDLTDPEAVARAYLAAAHSVTPADSGRTHRRAAGYAAPGTAPGAVGEVVLDPPPPGALRTAAATALELVAVDHDDVRRGYRAEVGTATGPPGGEVVVELVTRYVVLARQGDGRWLVAADSPATPDLPSGEH
jgi:hypothetical protein